MTIGVDARLFRSSVAGIGRYSQNIIKNILEIDKRNHYVLIMRPEDAKEFQAMGITGDNFRIKVIDIAHYTLTEQTKFLKYLNKQKFDLTIFLHCNVPTRYKGKYIVTIHDLTLRYYPEAAKKTHFLKQIIFNFVIKNACQKAWKIIAVSESTKKDIIREFGIAPEKIKVIYEAASDRFFGGNDKLLANLKDRYRLDKPVILYVGQYRRHKNITNLVKAYNILNKDLPSYLVLVGKDAKKTLDNARDLKDTEEQPSGYNDIITPGFVTDEELIAWYQLADVFVFPSLYEGFGLPGLEAMMAKTPVAASSIPSLKEVYRDGAVYFDPLRPEDIADKIKSVIQNKEFGSKLVERGTAIVRGYSWVKAAKETLELYNNSK